MHYMVHFPQQILKSILGIKFVFLYTLLEFTLGLVHLLHHGACEWRPKIHILKRLEKLVISRMLLTQLPNITRD